MLGKIVYSLSDGQIAFAVSGSNPDGISPIYNPQTQGVVKIEFTQDVMDNPTRYFYVDEAIVKDYYGQLELASDKTDTDGDGIEDMPADGTTYATYTIKKKDKDGNYMTGAGDNDLISISASRGLLSHRQRNLVNGEITFTLKSVEETVRIDVVVSNAALGRQSKQLQLVP